MEEVSVDLGWGLIERAHLSFFRRASVTQGNRSLQIHDNRQPCYLALKELVHCDNQLEGEMEETGDCWGKENQKMGRGFIRFSLKRNHWAPFKCE